VPGDVVRGTATPHRSRSPRVTGNYRVGASNGGH
jgi:hypothetical protein